MASLPSLHSSHNLRKNKITEEQGQVAGLGWSRWTRHSQLPHLPQHICCFQNVRPLLRPPAAWALGAQTDTMGSYVDCLDTFLLTKGEGDSEHAQLQGKERAASYARPKWSCLFVFIPSLYFSDESQRF